MSTATPEQVLRSIVDGINAGNFDALMTLYDPEAARLATGLRTPMFAE